MKRAAAAVACLALLVGCGIGTKQATKRTSAQTPTSTPSSTSTAPATGTTPSDSPSSPPAIDTEGSVLTKDGRFVTYPDGFTIRFLDAQLVSNAAVKRKDGAGAVPKAGNLYVLVRLRFENASPKAVPLTNNLFARAFYGSSRYEATQLYYGADNTFSNDPTPTQVGPHSKVVIRTTFEVPKAEVKTLVVTPNTQQDVGEPGYYTPLTFTEVGKALLPAK